MKSALKKIDDALEQLNAKRNSILKVEREIEEIKQSNLNDETKGMAIALFKGMKQKIEALQSEYHLDDKVKKKLLDIITPEDVREKFTIDILKKIIVSYTQLKEYEKFIDDYVNTKSNISDPQYQKIRGRITRALSVLKLYSNYNEYRNIENHIYSKIPEHPQEILFKLDADFQKEGIEITSIKKIVGAINADGIRASMPKHFKEEDLKELFKVGNRIGIFLKK